MSDQTSAPSKDESLFVYMEALDKHDIKRLTRVGPLRQVVSEYIEQIERLRAALEQLRASLVPYAERHQNDLATANIELIDRTLRPETIPQQTCLAPRACMCDQCAPRGGHNQSGNSNE